MHVCVDWTVTGYLIRLFDYIDACEKLTFSSTAITNRYKYFIIKKRIMILGYNYNVVFKHFAIGSSDVIFWRHRRGEECMYVWTGDGDRH